MHVIARLGILLCACGLGGCIFYPTRVEVYDTECRITTHRLELDVAMLDLNGATCPSGDQEACLLVIAAIGPASAVVSGSIVVVGNTLYWLERQGRCRYDFT